MDCGASARGPRALTTNECEEEEGGRPNKVFIEGGRERTRDFSFAFHGLFRDSVWTISRI